MRTTPHRSQAAELLEQLCSEIPLVDLLGPVPVHDDGNVIHRVRRSKEEMSEASLACETRLCRSCGPLPGSGWALLRRVGLAWSRVFAAHGAYQLIELSSLWVLAEVSTRSSLLSYTTTTHNGIDAAVAVSATEASAGHAGRLVQELCGSHHSSTLREAARLQAPRVPNRTEDRSVWVAMSPLAPSGLALALALCHGRPLDGWRFVSCTEEEASGLLRTQQAFEKSLLAAESFGPVLEVAGYARHPLHEVATVAEHLAQSMAPGQALQVARAISA